MATVVEGSLRVQWALRKFRQSTKTKIIKASKRTALSGLAKDIKKQIPGQFKDARKAVGWSLKRGFKVKKIEGKAGIHVGRKLKNKTRDEAKDKRTKPGVGITANNIHWMILGTGARFTEDASYRGVMKHNRMVRDIIARAWMLGKVKFMATMQKRMKQLIEQETAKLAAKGGK